MKEVWAWMITNREWLFSGVAIAIPLAILGWLFAKKSAAQRSDRGSASVAGSVSDAQLQSVHASNGSTVHQVGSITINQGLSAQDAQSLLVGTFEANFPRMVGAAADIAHARAIEFARNVFTTLEQIDAAKLSRVQDPAFMQSLYGAQRQYATTGDKDLQSMLIALLVQLSGAAPRSLLDISLQEAIDKAPKITTRQMHVLALVFVITRVPWEAFYKINDVTRFAADYLDTLLAGGVSDHNSYSHLASLGCVQVGPAPSEIGVFFMSHWRTLLTKGIPKERVNQLEEQSPGVRAMFVADDGSPALLRLAAQTNEQIEQLARSLGLSDEIKRKIFQLDSEYLLKGAEQAEFLRALHPAIARLWSVWTAPHAPLPRTQLTTLGVTLAHAQLSTLGKAPAPLSLWISPGVQQ